MTIIPREPFDRALSDHIDALGTIGFAQKAGMTTRQLNRIRSSDQPNPFHRAAEWSRLGSADTANQLVPMVCEVNDGFFIQEGGSDASNIEDTIQKAADVIKGLADGSLDDEDRRLVQEAVAAMIGLLQK